MAKRCVFIRTWQRFVFGLCLLCFLGSPLARAAIVNNNHLFQFSETMTLKVQALAAARGKTLPQLEPPIFLDKLPSHLYAKSLDIYEQIRRLGEQAASLEDQELPFRTLRPKDVLELLTVASDALDRELAAASIDPAGFQVEQPLGKTAADAYQSLWVLTSNLAVLVPPPDLVDTLQQIQRIEDEIKLIAQTRSLEFQAPTLNTPTDKQVRDVVLVMYQDMHLLGRLQRQLGTEAIIPGSPRTGQLRVSDIYDSARTTLADIHRMKTTLTITTAAPLPARPSSASINDLYARARAIHDLLLSLTQTTS